MSKGSHYLPKRLNETLIKFLFSVIVKNYEHETETAVFKRQ